MKYILVRYALLLELGLVSLISILTLAKDFRYLRVDDDRYLSDSTYRLQVDAWQKFGAAHIVGQERFLKSPVIIFLLVLSLLFVVFLFWQLKKFGFKTHLVWLAFLGYLLPLFPYESNLIPRLALCFFLVLFAGILVVRATAYHSITN